MYRSQQYLPFTVLKPAEYGRYFTSPIGESQQYLPFTVLKHRICLPTLATLGSQQYLPFTVLKLALIDLATEPSIKTSRNSTYRLRY